jgi:hypothetical protein
VKLLSRAFALVIGFGLVAAVHAQNTFPTSGNVGIGIASPTIPLQVKTETSGLQTLLHNPVGNVLLVQGGDGDNTKNIFEVRNELNRTMFNITGGFSPSTIISDGFPNPTGSLLHVEYGGRLFTHQAQFIVNSDDAWEGWGVLVQSSAISPRPDLDRVLEAGLNDGSTSFLVTGHNRVGIGALPAGNDKSEKVEETLHVFGTARVEVTPTDNSLTEILVRDSDGTIHVRDASTLTSQGPQGKIGPQGIPGNNGNDGANGNDGLQGEQGLAGADGAQGEQGLAGADAPCVDCDDVASAAVDLACLVLGENIPTSVAETEAAATIIVNTLLISTNVCEPDCDIGAGIQAAIDAKLNQ